MPFCCFKCHKELELKDAQAVGRRDSCQHCQADLHCCLNCKHYDLQAYNQCREVQAERVLEKDRSNFCDYFCFSDVLNTGSTNHEKKAAFDKLEGLFKK